jgi:peptidyl-prolyl cis-trans isomerase D
MFDFVHRHKRALQLVLALLIIPPFAFFGIDSYFRDGGGATAPVATVNGQAIGQQEFNIALRERQELLQQMSGGKADPAMLDNPEMRFAVAESLVTQRLLLQQATRSRLVATDQQLQSLLGQAPNFQEDGKFSQALYDQFLRSRGKTAPAFESDLRRDLLLRQVNDPYSESNFLPRTVVQQLARLMETQREASTFMLSPANFETKASVDGEASKKYYDSHADEFRTPELARVEYVALTLDSLLPVTEVSTEEVQKAFDDHAKRIQVQESRQASHILIAADVKASADEKQKAKAKAEELLNQVKAKPAAFADIAKANSQDPGSAVKGGDLGSFKRSDMVKPFSDAAFGMKVGDISGVVESEFGYHIIKLTDIAQAKPPSFEAMRPQIETDLKRQRAGKRFSELAEDFNNRAFEQSDSLKAAADVAKATVQQSNFLGRSGAASDPRLNHPKLLQAIFSEDVLKNKRNTEAVEVAPGTLVAARLLEHKPAVVRPFDEVKADIVNKLIRSRAAQLAAQDGRAALENLRQGKAAEVTWGNSQLVSFSNPIKDLSDDVRKQILRTDISKLPAYAGVETPAGYTLIRITRTVDPEKIEPEKEKNLALAMVQAQAQEQNAAFLASLKQKADIKIRKEQLIEKKEK